MSELHIVPIDVAQKCAVTGKEFIMLCKQTATHQVHMTS